ncbi:MAG: hypothetical protein RR100_12815, partial [Comamonas sp.]
KRAAQGISSVLAAARNTGVHKKLWICEWLGSAPSPKRAAQGISSVLAAARNTGAHKKLWICE